MERIPGIERGGKKGRKKGSRHMERAKEGVGDKFFKGSKREERR